MDGLPYIDVPQQFFGIINTFGILMAVGVLFATWLSRVYVERNGLDEEDMRWLVIRLVVWGFLGSYVLNTVFYEWDSLVKDPWTTIKAVGISSYGAMVVGALAFFYYTGVRGLDRRKWADMMAWGGAAGWLLGRLGCALAHDHLGQKTDFALGVNVPPGRYPFERSSEVIRAHDLGLYEFFLWTFIIVAVVLLERWKRRKPGFLFGFMMVVYSVPRFFFETLRMEATDPRYGGLTFAQWSSIGFFTWALYLLFAPAKPSPAPIALSSEGKSSSSAATSTPKSAPKSATKSATKPTARKANSPAKKKRKKKGKK